MQNSDEPSVATPSLQSGFRAPEARDFMNSPVGRAPLRRGRMSPIEEARHLVRRAGFGGDRAYLQRVVSVGWKRWLDEQLDPYSIPDPVEAQIAQHLPEALMDTRQVWDNVRAVPERKFGWAYMDPLSYAQTTRICYSTRQVYENLCDFWSNHFNITNPSSEVWDSRGEYDQIIRRFTLGTFPDMLVNVAFSKAMLKFLDNYQSTKTRPNENYARELLELHTVGVGAFSENDVKMAAQLLTGWRAAVEQVTPNLDPNRHDGSGGTILGYNVPAHDPAYGRAEQEKFLRWLAVQPATARYVCTKLAVRFVRDIPPASLVSSMTRVWLDTGGNLKAVVRHLFHSPEFWGSRDAKLRRPLDDVSATVRALGLPAPTSREGMQRLHWLVVPTGQPPCGWAMPDGYSMVAADFQSAGSQLALWNFHILLGAGWYPKQLNLGDPKRFRPATPPATLGQLLDEVTDRLGQPRLAQHVRLAILGHFNRGEHDSINPANDQIWVWDFHLMLAMILDSPDFKVR